MTPVKRTWRRNWIVLTAIVVHGFWGLVLLVDPAPLDSIPLAGLKMFGAPASAAILFATATLAGIHYAMHDSFGSFTGVCLLAPQQILMMGSAATVVLCVLEGQYADGTVRPSLHILADQWWVLCGMIGHSCALVDWFWFAPQ